MEHIDNCSSKDYNWAEDTLLNVIDAASQGDPGAIAELQRREKQIDTVSANA